MSKKTTALREQSVADLEKELVSLTKEQFNLRMQRASGQTIRPHRFKEARRSVARIKTIIAQKSALKDS